MIDERICETTVVLMSEAGERELTAGESSRVIESFEAVRHEATKFRLTTGQAGRLLLIDPDLVATVHAFLNAGKPEYPSEAR